MPFPRLTARYASVLALALAAAAVAVLLFVPIYAGEVETMGLAGAIQRTSTHETLLQVNGAHALGPLLFPVAVAVLPVLRPESRALRVAAVVLLGGFVFLGAMSIGLFYLPALVALIFAAVLPSPGRAKGEGPSSGEAGA